MLLPPMSVCFSAGQFRPLGVIPASELAEASSEQAPSLRPLSEKLFPVAFPRSLRIPYFSEQSGLVSALFAPPLQASL